MCADEHDTIIKHIVDKPGMYAYGQPTFEKAFCLLEGYNLATSGAALDTFNYWMLTRRQTYTNGGWAHTIELDALEKGVDPIAHLREMVNDFIADRREIGKLGIIAAYNDRHPSHACPDP